MKLLFAALALFVCSQAVEAQAIRFDYVASTTNSSCAPGALCNIQAIPGAVPIFCTAAMFSTVSTSGTVVSLTSGPSFIGASGPIQISGTTYQIQTVVSASILVLATSAGNQTGATASTITGCLDNPLTTFNSVSANVQCPSSAQLTMPGTLGKQCVSAADNQGNFGIWFSPQTAYYYLTAPATAGGGVFGPYPFSMGVNGQASGVTYNQGSTGAVTRTVASKLQEVVSIQDFGATGGGENDSAALAAAQTAVCALAAGGGAGITFPPPTSSAGYSFSSNALAPCNDLQYAATGSHPLLNWVGSGALFDTNGKSYITFSNLSIVCTSSANQVGIYVDGATSPTSYTTLTDMNIANCGTPPPSITGAAINVVGNNLDLEIGRATLQVTGTGIAINSTVDLLNIHNVTCGVPALGNDSGFCLTITNSEGSGAAVIRQLNAVTPGGAAYIGPLAGITHVEDSQFELLPGGHALDNAENAAWVFDSALYLSADHMNTDLHSNGNYCYFTQNSSYGTFTNNQCFDPSVNQWNNTGGTALTFSGNSDLQANNDPTYVAGTYPGIEQIGYGTGYRSWGTQYPQAPRHLNGPYIPQFVVTSLTAAVTMTLPVSISVASVFGMKVGTILYIDSEQCFIDGAIFGTTVPVSCGYNGTTPATHLVNAPVTVGPAGQFLITSTGNVSGTTLGFGVDQGFNYVASRQFTGGVWIPVPFAMENLRVQSLSPITSTQAIITGIPGQGNPIVNVLNATAISACTNANPVVCTTTTTPPPGPATVILSGFQGTWIPLNGVHTSTNISGVQFSLPIDSTAFGPLTGTIPQWNAPMFTITSQYQAIFGGTIFTGSSQGITGSTCSSFKNGLCIAP